MTTNWQIKKLNEVCEVEYGTRVVNKRDGGSKYSVYGGGGATFFMDEYNREDKMVVARFAMSESCTRFVKGKFFLNDSGLTVAPKNNKEISQDFLDHQLIFLNDHIYSLARGAAQKNLDVPAFRNMNISYPDSLVEQKRIVKILDEVFNKLEKAKENAEKNLQNSKALFDSYLQKIFTNKSEGWKIKNLKEVSEYFIGLTYSPKDVSDQGIIVLRSSNIQNDKLDFSDIVRVNRPVKESLKVKEGDILMCSRNGSKRLVGKTALIHNLKEVMTFGTFMMIVRGQYNPYLYWFFKSSNFRKQILGGENTMINQITRYMLDAVILSFPPQEKQGTIVKKLDTLSEQTKKLEVIYKKKLADLEELKKSVLKKAFNGEL